MKTKQLFTVVVAGLMMFGHTAMADTTPEQAKQIAKEAYVFAYPMLENYKTMYIQAINTNSPDYKGPFNKFGHMTKLLDADFTAVTAPNNDTYYSFLWMDLRKEPLVVTVPLIPDNRYFVLQLIDINAINFDYIGSRATGNNGGTFLIAGPDWNGKKPQGVDKVFKSETQFNLMLGRLLVNGEADHENAMKILNQYKLQTLSEFNKEKAPNEVAQVNFPAYDSEKANSIGFIDYFNFMLNYETIHPDDQKYFDEFKKIGIYKGNKFDKSKISPKILSAIKEGVKEGYNEILERKKTTGKMVNGWSFIGETYGNRAFLQGKLLLKAAGAATGLYGNDMEEASNFSGSIDADKKPLNCDKNQKYTIRFEKGQTPPVNAFWSMTMYKLPEVLFIHNPINRYSISDRNEGIKFDNDGSLTLYFQHESPGKELESNWLPAPKGAFMLGLRIYYPKSEVYKGEWVPPVLKKVKK